LRFKDWLLRIPRVQPQSADDTGLLCHGSIRARAGCPRDLILTRLGWHKVVTLLQ